MSRALGVSLFLAFALLIVGSTHYYLWARLIRDIALPAPWFELATLAIAFLGISLPGAMVLARLLSGRLARILVWFAFSWMGVFFLLLCLVAAADVLHFFIWFALKFLPLAPLADPASQIFVARLIAATVTLIAIVGGIVASRLARRGPVVTHIQVTLSRWPKALDDFTVVQISDLHVAPLLSLAYVENVVALANAAQPALICITGDLVDGSVRRLRHAIAPLKNLQAKYGTFFVTGNHEYYAGVDAWLREISSLGIRVLRNERVTLGGATSEPDASFDLAGIDDWTARRFGNGHGSDLGKALAGRDARRELILLAHQPKAVYQAAEQGVGLMLSGHTHGGQIWPFGYIVRLVQPYLKGLNRHGPTQVYVSRGTGYWGPPMRLGAPPEITVLHIRAPGEALQP